MAHAHHDHKHDHQRHDRAFAIGIALNLGFVAIESVYGVLAHSMALLADAGHNLSDVLALALAWGASILGRRVPSRRFTYGLGSSSILAALVNAMLLMLVVGGIAVEATQRLLEPVSVATVTVIWVALAGIVVNTSTALLFLRGREHDLNVKGAFLHMAADAAVSAGYGAAGQLGRAGSVVVPGESLAEVLAVKIPARSPLAAVGPGPDALRATARRRWPYRRLAAARCGPGALAGGATAEMHR